MIVYRELSTLERDLGVSAGVMYCISNNLSSHYRNVVIPKKDGGERKLTVPDEQLKSIQRRIAQVLLTQQPASKYATAYRYGSRILHNASPHVGRSMVLKLDIQNFFDSILYSQVKERAFPACVYSEKLRVLLTMLCYYKDSLPQGAPTSPAISNVILRDFDECTGAWCAQRGIIYTRYCDDMTFSGDFDASELICFVEAKLKELGFFINRSKTRLMPAFKRQAVTGIVVNRKCSVPTEYRRRLRQELYYCRKFGVQEHLKQLGIEEEPEHYLLRLLGRVSHVLSVTPGNKEMREYRKWILNEVKKTH